MITLNSIKTGDIILYSDPNKPEYDCIGQVIKFPEMEDIDKTTVIIKWEWATEEFANHLFLKEVIVDEYEFDRWSEYLKIISEKEKLAFILSR